MKIPPLEIPATQERPDALPTESETFYRTALLSKLLAMETSPLDSTQNTIQTLNCTDISSIALNTNTTTLSKQQKRTFNLSKILQNSVYPEECTQNDNLINASVIQNHLSGNSSLEQTMLMFSNEAQSGDKVVESKINDEEDVFLDDTIVDEELILSLTQKPNRTIQNQEHEQFIPMDATCK